MNRFVLCLALLVSVPAWCQAPPASPPGKPKPVSPFADYAGLWTGKFDDRIWLQVQLTLTGEKLTGSIVHSRDINLADDGGIKSVSEEQTTETVTDAVVNPDGLLLTVKDSNTQESDRFVMKLVMPAKDAADLKMIGQPMPAGMPKPKPWRVVKSGIATTNR